MEFENENLKAQISNITYKYEEQLKTLNEKIKFEKHKNLLSEDEIKEQTYIIIKNFEGKGVSLLNIQQVNLYKISFIFILNQKL